MSCADELRAQPVVCVSRAVSHLGGGAEILTNSLESSGRSCGKDTLLAPPAHFDTSQPEVFSGVELVSRATYISSKRRNCETRQRQSKAHKSAEREAKRKLLAQPEISHEAAEQILLSQAARTDENFPGIMHVSHQLALLHGHDNVFFCKQCGAVNAGGTLRVVKSLCDGTGEPCQKARRELERGLKPTEQVTAGAKRAFLIAAFFFP